MEEEKTKCRELFEKFKNANPEEREKILAELKTQREKEEKERKRKFYEDRKKIFVDKANLQINILDSLFEARTIAMRVIETFDGKVLNNRLTNAVKARLEEKDDSFRVSLLIKYDSKAKGNVGVLTLKKCYYGSKDLYNEYEITILLSPLSDGNRVLYEETRHYEDNSDTPLFNRRSSWKEGISTYDKTFNEAVKLGEKIRKYADFNNVHIREYIRQLDVIPTYYL